MGKLLKITLVGIVVAFIAERIVRLSDRLNFYREVQPIDLPHCQLLKGIEFGSEDIDILPNGLAFISSGLKVPGLMSFAPEKPGEIFLLDLNDEELLPISLRFSRDFELASFNPHGISTYIDEKDDTVYLFVVNHPHYKSTVEIFKFLEEDNVLMHLKTIKHALLHSVNDIIAVGPESFYATNDFYFTDYTMRHVEMVLGLAWSNAVYYSPGEVKQVASGFYSSNGINVSPDEKYVYVADIMDHKIHVLEKHANWSLTPVKELNIETVMDNLSVDPHTGDIWTGAHPYPWKLLNYNKENLPWSEVIRIQNILSDDPIVTQVYVNNGSVIQGTSSASVFERKLLVGSVFHKALYCELD
ncbi:serum paraoxonase/arylesterase 2 [Bombina bombina]|uniref:serum paraoxonase/arylesterase 2 n=1 Tax=Bombina bombina TaxID=8345 RepID=UPI00235A7CA7|nr:serum paraoxonase/arylesterase 2 [Bombina bombina]